MRQRFITTILFLILTANIFAQPRWGDTFWRDSVPETMRKDYISFGEQYKGKEWHSLPAATFAEFKKTGNRTNYEGLLFEKRRQLAALVLAEVIEGKRRFLPDIINGLQSTLEETCRDGITHSMDTPCHGKGTGQLLTIDNTPHRRGDSTPHTATCGKDQLLVEEGWHELEPLDMLQLAGMRNVLRT